MLKFLGLIFWGMVGLSIIAALGFQEAIGEYPAYHVDGPRPSPVELQALAYSFLLWVSGVAVWVLGSRIWRRVKG